MKTGRSPLRFLPALLALAVPMLSLAAEPPPVGGLLGGAKNAGQTAYLEALARQGSAPVPGIPEAILLWPNGAPGAKPDANGAFTDEDKPAIYAFPAPANNNTGAAFLILPGGGFTNRVIDTEGIQIAKFLNRHGIGGFVLRYRIGATYPDRATSTLDAQRGMRFIRAHAAEYKVAADRIGAIGFSAGGELETNAFYNSILEGDPAAADPLDRFTTRANFGVLIYGGRAPIQNPASAPPTFFFATLEDTGGSGAELPIFNALRQAGIPTEAHFFQVGPHGTTMSPGDPQLGQWPELVIKWLKSGRFLTAK